MDLVRSMGKPLQSSVVAFLRSQECGFDQGYPMVCCSMLPKAFQLLKLAKPYPRRPINTLSTDLPTKVAPLTTSTTTKKSITRNLSKSGEKLLKKADALNEAFMSDYFDYAGSFDLMLRIKRDNSNGSVDIEIK